MLKHYDISKEQLVELSCMDTTNGNPDATSEGASEPQVIDHSELSHTIPDDPQTGKYVCM